MTLFICIMRPFVALFDYILSKFRYFAFNSDWEYQKRFMWYGVDDYHRRFLYYGNRHFYELLEYQDKEDRLTQLMRMEMFKEMRK